ncbi:MAG: cyclic nucleotide-binding domain-containing protein [Magnetococcales bacterium]|nr:cyclic nucleotide-binding domain-containing protein [Magnetococcales bacterium]NGZ25496.1 cyclic nucleotide-binding domain-containing protein [Magnetococcales bacterium]
MNVSYLEGISLFSSLSLAERELLCQVAHSFLQVEEGEKVIREGEAGGALFVILQGSATVTKGKEGEETVLARLAQGDSFGEMSFLTKKTRSTNVVVDEPSLILKMDERLFDNLNPLICNKIKDHIIDLLVQRLDKMNQTLAMLVRYAPKHG